MGGRSRRPEALLQELRAAGGRVEHFADPHAPAAVIDATHRAFGRLDVVVANHARNNSPHEVLYKSAK